MKIVDKHKETVIAFDSKLKPSFPNGSDYASSLKRISIEPGKIKEFLTIDGFDAKRHTVAFFPEGDLDNRFGRIFYYKAFMKTFIDSPNSRSVDWKVVDNNN